MEEVFPMRVQVKGSDIAQDSRGGEEELRKVRHKGKDKGLKGR